MSILRIFPWARAVSDRWRLLALVAACGLPGWVSLHATPELHGYVVEDNEVLFFLRDDETREARWVTVGAHFGVYRVVRWQAAHEIVVLQNKGETLALPFVAGKVGEARSDNEAVEERGILENVQRLAVSACQHFLEQEVRSVRATDLVGPGKTLYRIEPVAGENYDHLGFTVGREGLRLTLDGGSQPLPESTGSLVIQVAPTLSLSAISRRLGIPLATLQRLNPQHAANDRITEWTSVRLW